MSWDDIMASVGANTVPQRQDDFGAGYAPAGPTRPPLGRWQSWQGNRAVLNSFDSGEPPWMPRRRQAQQLRSMLSADPRLQTQYLSPEARAEAIYRIADLENRANDEEARWNYLKNRDTQGLLPGGDQYNLIRQIRGVGRNYPFPY